MLILSESIGSNLKPIVLFLITFLSIFIFMPPALFGQTIETGRNYVKLTWTATGDDSTWGQSSIYDIRYSTEPVGTDTALWWQSAKRAENLPTPSLSGKKDSCVIYNLSINHHYYFAIKAADEAYNWSDIVRIAELPKVSCADVNGDQSFDYIDLVYLLSYLYEDDPPPVAPGTGDVDNSGEINVADVMYIINYRLNSGPPPDCGE
ncbi:MAG: hypothetical protein DRP51_06170 [Candidatus Zixiibacteriota bacterium]|nr:MAG: hypothetical protein DRP51_06170 [candidate division Zixibacteria bacterium]